MNICALKSSIYFCLVIVEGMDTEKLLLLFIYGLYQANGPNFLIFYES